jgi:hypothetical protein
MKKIFRKAITVLGSAALIGMTIGSAAAAAYPSPFTSNTAIVYGSGVAMADMAAVTDIAENIDANTPTISMGDVSIDGENVPLDSGSTKIWLNTSLNTAKTTLTKSDLPTVLKQTTFSGNVDSKLTSTIAIGANKVTFAKQPSTNVDPVLAVTTSSSVTDPLYNLSVTMPAISFNHTDSEGETIELFGNEFVVSTATSGTSLVLFSSAKQINLVAGGASPNPSETVVIDGTSYEVEIITGTSTTATVAVNGVSKEITEGSSKKINGIDIAVKSVTESTALDTVNAALLVGSNKITFTEGSQVLVGSDDDPVDGTKVSFTGTSGRVVDSLTAINIAVYAPDSSSDAIVAGNAFEDPVFGGFSVVFSELTSPLDDANREAIVIDKAGDKGMSLTLTEEDGATKTFDFAYNATTTFLGDSNSYKIYNQENQSFQVNNYTMIGNEDYGHLVQLTYVYNFTGTDYSKDTVRFKDVITGENYEIDATSEGGGRLTIDGRQYTVVYSGTGDTGSVRIKYPTADSSAAQLVMFPTIKTEAGALVGLYEPQTYTLGSVVTGIKFPDGDGYTTAAIVASDDQGNFTIDGSVLNASAGVNVTVGTLTYNFGQVADATSNQTTIKLITPGPNQAILSSPAVVIFEGKNDTSIYNTIVVDVEANAAGTSSDPLGANDVYFSGGVWDSVALQSDSDISQSVDIWGSHVAEDSNTASQKIVTIAYPKEQVSIGAFIAEASAVSGGSTDSVGVKTYADSESASFAGMNLIVVGGSAINAIAAELLGSAYSEQAFTDATGIGAGEFLIKSFPRNGKTALLVAGYNAADTEKAAKVLLNEAIDTAEGREYKGISSTESVTVIA